MPWKLWTKMRVEREAADVTPVLASWNASTHPDQVRLRSYLDAVVPMLLPLPAEGDLFLHMDIDVQDPKRLLRHHDLENYLTPLFGSRWLPANRFVLVSARKFVGGGSRISWGVACPCDPPADTSWSHLTVEAGRSASTTPWKERIRTALIDAGATLLPAGPVQVQLAWRCSTRRNWSMLWKPTGDAMGPVLGCANASRPYHVDDDRIQDLELHLQGDDELDHDVVAGLWWRRCSTPNFA